MLQMKLNFDTNSHWTQIRVWFQLITIQRNRCSLVSNDCCWVGCDLEKNAYNHWSDRHGIELKTNPMRIREHARGCRCRCRSRCWDGPTRPCDHYLKCYAAAAARAWASQPDSTDPYTYCHPRTHFLCTAARCGASRTSPDSDGIPFCAAAGRPASKYQSNKNTPDTDTISWRGRRMQFAVNSMPSTYKHFPETIIQLIVLTRRPPETCRPRRQCTCRGSSASIP